MKKSYLLLAAAAMTLASCSNDGFLGGLFNADENGTDVIAFGTSALNATRADADGTFTGKTAAEKLNNNFIVYGFKYTGDEEAANGTDDHAVFNLYNVNYEDGSAKTTESNTSGWEYVGLAPHNPDKSGITEQTIKYWDYEAKGYVFSAVSGVGITASKTPDGATIYDKGWNVTVPAGGSLSDLYVSNRLPISPADYKNQVTLTFYNMGTRIRFAVYETVPGYSVQINNFYYTESATSTPSSTNFVIDGGFRTLNPTSTTDLNVSYYGEGSEIINRPKVTYDDNNVTKYTYGTFGTNIQPTEKIGTASNEATYDQEGGEYTMILPYQVADNNLQLKVDYTLTSTDGSNETIKVKGASATVPANYTQWKENFAYTYIFKISDNTNGYTGDDPTKAGLYPITFDACVVNAQDGIQETITSVSEPSITTYQCGKIVTENDEYVAGDIYFNVMKDAAIQTLSAQVYELQYSGSEELTEKVVANWKNNGCVLIPVETNTAVTSVPLSDGTTLSFTAGTLGHFFAKSGKTYGIYDATNKVWKVVKVSGDEVAETYTLTTTTNKITSQTGAAVCSLVSNSPADNTMVLGAAPEFKITNAAGKDVTTNFTITDNYDGTYNFVLTVDAIRAGADGTYTVSYGDKKATFTVDLHYAIRNSSTIDVIAGNSNTFRLTIGNSAADLVNLTKAVIVNENAGITVEETATAGTYKVSAASTVANGTYTATIAGQTLTIKVTSYAFSSTNIVMTKPYNDNVYANVTLLSGSEAQAIDASKIEGTSTGLEIRNDGATADGHYTLTGSKGGTWYLSYENAKATVTVNAYTLTAGTSTIKKSTGKSTLTLKCNDKVINASTANVVVFKDYTNNAHIVKTGYALTTNGQTMTFSNVTTAGTYYFYYKVDGKVVATATVTVE